MLGCKRIACSPIWNRFSVSYWVVTSILITMLYPVPSSWDIHIGLNSLPASLGSYSSPWTLGIMGSRYCHRVHWDYLHWVLPNASCSAWMQPPLDNRDYDSQVLTSTSFTRLPRTDYRLLRLHGRHMWAAIPSAWYSPLGLWNGQRCS